MTHVGFVTGATAQAQLRRIHRGPRDRARARSSSSPASCSTAPTSPANFAGRRAAARRPFWWRRALRIFPAYWLALTVLIVVFGLDVSGAARHRRLLRAAADLRHAPVPRRDSAGVDAVHRGELLRVPSRVRVGTAQAPVAAAATPRLRVELFGAAVLIACLLRVPLRDLQRSTAAHAVGRIAAHWLPGIPRRVRSRHRARRDQCVRREERHDADRRRVGAFRGSGGPSPRVLLAGRDALGLARSPQAQNTPIGWQARPVAVAAGAVRRLISSAGDLRTAEPWGRTRVPPLATGRVRRARVVRRVPLARGLAREVDGVDRAPRPVGRAVHDRLAHRPVDYP